ncbi:MAG: Phosphoenolpyruvate carboxykinase, partial [Deltaproteobacteria bacterium]|nr:Phosphoenolpyruvate carboxykinase [Deltaproteobacteria bacterium]
KQPPLIFRTNWFRQSQEGKFLWPGFGENLRVLRWVIERVHQEAGAMETPIGYVPRPQDIDTNGIPVSPAMLQELLAVDPQGWLEAAEGQREFFNKFGERMPAEILKENATLEQRLKR